MLPTHFEQISTAILALFPPLSETEQRISLALYRLLAEGRQVSTDLLADAAGLESAEVERTVSGWREVYRDGDGRIVGYAGLTIVETRHRMRIDGKVLHAWCAWDTLFLPPLLGAAARVESTCAATGERINLTVHPDRVEHGHKQPLVSLVVPDHEKAWADIVSHFCCHVQFLADRKAADGWADKHPATRVATLEQAWQLGRRRNELRYPVRKT